MGKPSKWIKIKNWFYDKWMRLCGYQCYTYNIYDNSYTYIKKQELNELVKISEENEPEFEIIHYKRLPSAIWYKTEESDNKARMSISKSLIEGKDNARIIRRSL